MARDETKVCSRVKTAATTYTWCVNERPWMAVSTISIASHAYFQPYKDEHKDRLQFFVLMSSWVCLYTLFVRKFNGWDGWSFIIILFGSQVLIVGFGLHALWYAESRRVKGQMTRIMTKAKTFHKKVVAATISKKSLTVFGDGV